MGVHNRALCSAESRQCCACPLRCPGVVGHMCLFSQHPSSPDVQINVTKLWLQFSTMILAFVFVFGNSLKVVFEAVVFLFVVHPFDIGDGVLIGTTGTDYYRVRPHICHLLPQASSCRFVCCCCWAPLAGFTPRILWGAMIQRGEPGLLERPC